VDSIYFITDQFDIRTDFWIQQKQIRKLLLPVIEFIWSVYKYKCVYIYFNGGPLGLGTVFLWRAEPYLYHLANTKVVVMPYGGDVQDMTRSSNLLFKDAMSRDYPEHRVRRSKIGSKIDLWTKLADHVISGCEWVDYMYHWDTLMIAHFSINTEAWKPRALDSEQVAQSDRKLRILHAPNHKAIKGTQLIIRAIKELQEEGVAIELITLEQVPNDRIHDVIQSVDMIVDQLIIGWYAMFAIEAMACAKPVLCYLRDDLIQLYTVSGLIEPDEIPIINCSPLTIKQSIKNLAFNPELLKRIEKKSREYVLRHHSTKAIGDAFASINQSIGLFPQH
jgi:glycosyltransferase involved in cell wall biosynthesis